MRFIAPTALVWSLTACGGGSSDVSAGDSANSPVPTSFSATVSITDFDATCRQVKCWLPTQFEPKLVERQTVSIYDKWPMDGDKVEVLCQTEGEGFSNQSGNWTTAWYGIRVPDDKLESSAAKRAEKAPNGGYIGYVGVSWLKSEANAQAPAC